MYWEAGGQHNKPHLHAYFGGDEVAVDFGGDVLQGGLPKSKMKLLLAWMIIHRDELEANWQLILAGEPCFKIEPLR